MANQPPQMPKVPKLPKQRMPFSGGSFSNNIMSAFLIFLIIVFIYSFFADNQTPATEVAISEIAADINTEKISEITVKGTEVTAKYPDGELKKAKKETE